MSTDVPDYYRSLASSDDASDSESEDKASSAPASNEDTGPGCRTYRADAFALTVPTEGWQDQSLYAFSGPTVDDMTHRMSISITAAVDTDRVADFADEKMNAFPEQFESCDLLIHNPVELDCGHPAHRAIFVQCPDDSRRTYQEQIYTVHSDTGYTLTAAFTPTSRKQIGRAVEAMMLSFQPTAYAPSS